LISVQNNPPSAAPSNNFYTRLCRDPGPSAPGWLIGNSYLSCYVSDQRKQDGEVL